MVDWNNLQITKSPKVVKHTLTAHAIIYNHQTNNRYGINVNRRYIFGDEHSHAKAEEAIVNDIHNRVKNPHTYIGFLKIGNNCYKGQQLIYKNI